MANKLSESTEHSMVVRVITSLVFALLTVPCAILGGWFMMGLSFVLVGFGTYEVLALPGKNKFHPVVWIATYVAVYYIVYSPYLWNDVIRDLLFKGNCFYIDGFQLSIVAMMIYLAVLFLCYFFSKEFRITDLFYLFTMTVLVAVGFYSVIFMRFYPVGLDGYYPAVWNGFTPDLSSCLLLWWVLFGVWTSDIGAYFTGVFFGKHPMNARISPHKTWEGFWGGTAFSLVFTAVYASIICYACRGTLLGNVIDLRNDPSDWGWVVLIGVLMPILDNVGGFIFSAVKRQYGAKDWGFILPGHGGILDRFDSALTASIAIAPLLLLIAGA